VKVLGGCKKEKAVVLCIGFEKGLPITDGRRGTNLQLMCLHTVLPSKSFASEFGAEIHIQGGCGLRA
jgi:hypothetical protein